MKIPQQLKEKLVKELKFIATSMAAEADLSKKIYFYSGVFGALERVMRYHLDKELLIAHALTSISYTTINDRLNHLKMGDTVVPMPQNVMDQLTESISELRQAIQEDRETYPVLEKIAEITYSTTGPGFYTQSFLAYAQAHQGGQEE